MALQLRSRDTMLIYPNVEIEIHEGDDGPIIERIKTHNLITDSGLVKFRNMVAYPANSFDPQLTTPQYIAVGTGATAADNEDTTLGTEVFRKAITARYPQTFGIEFYLNLSTSEANTNTLTEAGVFSVAEDGTLWARCTHAAINKTASVSVTYRWTWTFGVPA